MKIQKAKVGQNVRLKVPDIDRAKTDTESIIAVVVDVKDNEFYQLGTKIGVHENFIKIEEASKDKKVSFREIVRKLSLTGGQGLKKM